MSAPSLDPEQRSRLLGAKLRVLVDEHVGPAPPDGARVPVPFAGGAAIVEGGRAWLLLDDVSTHGLGSALAWAQARGVDDLVVLSEEPGAGWLARQAAHFAEPPSVLRIIGRAVAVADAAPIEPPPPAPDWALAQTDALLDAGLEVVVEHGIVSGEVLGLEVAQVVRTEAGEARIDVGVGRNDREAFAMLHGDLPAPAALARVVTAVTEQRRPGAPAHPLNRLASERWLRRRLLSDPARLGGWELRAVPGPVARTSVNDRLPAYAVGTDAHGAAVVVAFSHGIDLELVPRAADARALHDPAARLVLVMPARDAHDVTRALAASLVAPADILAVEGDWRA